MSMPPMIRVRPRTAVVLTVMLGLVMVGVSHLSYATAGAEAQHTQVSAKATHKSWNPYVKCRATVTTLRQVLGKLENANGGATYRGGRFKPGIPDRRDFTPPCFRHHVPTFVQLNRVKIGSCDKINEDGDWTCNLTDPSVPRGRSDAMSSIHVETDQKFQSHSGWTKPPGGKLLNIQGFVFWDPGHTNASWHHFTGWEIHSLTAWRHSPKR